MTFYHGYLVISCHVFLGVFASSQFVAHSLLNDFLDLLKLFFTAEYLVSFF